MRVLTYPVGGNQDAVKYKDETVGRYSMVVLDAKAFRLSELPRRPSSLDRSCAHSKVRAEQPGGEKRFRRAERLAHMRGNPSNSADMTPRSCSGNIPKRWGLLILCSLDVVIETPKADDCSNASHLRWKHQGQDIVDTEKMRLYEVSVPQRPSRTRHHHKLDSGCSTRFGLDSKGKRRGFTRFRVYQVSNNILDIS